MADEPQDIERRLSGIDQGRALPSDLSAELVDRLLDQSASGALAPIDLHGADSPRAVPAAVARRVNEAVLAVVPSARWRRGLRVDGRAAGVAAVLLLLIGTLAAISRAAPGGEDSALTRADVSPFDPWPSLTAPPTSEAPAAPPQRVVALSESDPAYARLERFDSCQEVLDWVRPRAEAQTDEWGLAGGFWATGRGSAPDQGGGGASQGSGGGGGAGGEGDPSQPQPAAAPMGEGGGRSQTNVVVAGVDEPDLMKATDDALLVVQGSQLHLVSTENGGAALAGSMSFDHFQGPFSLLVHEQTALLLGAGTNAEGGSRLVTNVRSIDVRDPAAPVEVRVDQLPGRLVSARLVDGTAHLVTTDLPGPFEFVHPDPSGDPSTEVERAVAENRRVIRESTIEQWVPAGVPCEQVAHPRDAADFSLVSLWSVPIDNPSQATVAALIANAQALSATSQHLVVATARSDQPDPESAGAAASAATRTHLHRFSLTPEGPQYLASGSVPGVLPFGGNALESSHAISARGEVVRVATTNEDGTFTGAPGQSQVTVLEDTGGGLLEIVGSVTGLGEAGERIVGVRFVGDIAFVVTFLRTDPLYVIDLSDPKNPRRRGELKTPGFSAYLHPLADGRLLGVGQSSDDEGAWGAAVSIYDVSDLDAPRLADRQVHPRTFYRAQWDFHSFLLWQPNRQIVLPATTSEGHSFEVLRLGSQGELVHQGALRHAGEHTSSLRAAMLDGGLYTVSSAGVLVSDPDTLAERAWAPWYP